MKIMASLSIHFSSGELLSAEERKRNNKKIHDYIKELDITEKIHAMKIQGQQINDFVVKALLLLLLLLQ